MQEEVSREEGETRKPALWREPFTRTPTSMSLGGPQVLKRGSYGLKLKMRKLVKVGLVNGRVHA